MRHYKQSADNHILSIGTGYGGEEITESEYNEIMAVIKSCPHLDGKGYRLKTDLTWETYDVPPTTGTPPATEIEMREALTILGVDVP